MKRQAKEMRLVYRDFLLDINKSHPEVVALEADLSSSMGTNNLGKAFGMRYINGGIMESEMVGLAAGLSIQGFKPYFHTFGPFASRRVFDQLFISLGYAQLSATVIGSDAGISAEMNGGTHMPFEDLGLLRLVPNATVFEVSDDIQFESVLQQTLHLSGLKYIRTIRKKPSPLYKGDEDFSKGYINLKQGKDLTLVCCGIMVAPCLEVANSLEKEGYSVGVIDLFRVKAIHPEVETLLLDKPILTVENHNVIGGLGSAICEMMATKVNTPVYRLGIKERFGQVGQQDYLLNEYGLDKDSIRREIQQILS